MHPRPSNEEIAVNALRTVVLILGLFGLVPVAVAAGRVVLDATPTVRIDSDPEHTRRTVLSGPARLEGRVLVVEREGRYYWATRQNRELLRAPSGGAAHYFIDPTGGGYVKVVDVRGMPGPKRTAAFEFYEHVGLGMGTITYFGTAKTFEP